MGSRRSNRCERTFGGKLGGSVWLLVCLVWMGGNLSAARASDTPDDGLLEFLGSVDSEDKDWHDYLARTDIDEIARRAGTQAGDPGGGVPVHAKPASPAAPTGDPPPVPPPAAATPVTPP